MNSELIEQRRLNFVWFTVVLTFIAVIWATPVLAARSLSTTVYRPKLYVLGRLSESGRDIYQFVKKAAVDCRNAGTDCTNLRPADELKAGASSMILRMRIELMNISNVTQTVSVVIKKDSVCDASLDGVGEVARYLFPSDIDLITNTRIPPGDRRAMFFDFQLFDLLTPRPKYEIGREGASAPISRGRANWDNDAFKLGHTYIASAVAFDFKVNEDRGAMIGSIAVYYNSGNQMHSRIDGPTFIELNGGRAF